MRSIGQHLVDAWPRLYRYALALTREPDAARDLMQQSALKALSTRTTPREPRAARAYRSFPFYQSFLFFQFYRQALVVPLGLEHQDRMPEVVAPELGMPLVELASTTSGFAARSSSAHRARSMARAASPLLPSSLGRPHQAAGSARRASTRG